jgi:hypothetical protein
MVDKSITLCKDTSGWFFAMRQSGQAASAWSETHPTSSADSFTHHATTLYPHLAFLALKRRPVARGKRAPREPSIVGWFFPLPWLAYAAGTVAPDVCPLVLQAARVPLATLYGGAQSDNTLATIPDWPEAVGTAAPLPRYGERARLPHVGPSD